MAENMKISEGYKMTEVGVIPEEWEVISFGESFRFLSTGNNARSELSDSGTVNYIHYGDIHTKWKYTLDVSNSIMPFIDEVKIKHLPFLKDGDLVMVDVSEDYDGIGLSVEIKNIRNKKVVSGLHTFLLRDNKTYFVDGFKAYIQSMKFVKDSICKIATGISVYGISKNVLKHILIPVPPLQEQQAIATALTDIDNLITSIERLIDKKEKIKQGTMQELLTGKKRLSGFSGEWGIRKLGDIADIRTGKKNNEDKTKDGKYPFFVRSQNIERINSYSYNGEAILIPGEGGIGSIYHYINGRFDYHQRVYKISDFLGMSGKFIYYFMKQNFNKHAMQNSVKATVDSLRLPTFEEFVIIHPKSEEEQQSIAQVLSDMDSEIEALKQKLEKYKTIKQGMMQELLTGRIRLV